MSIRHHMSCVLFGGLGSRFNGCEQHTTHTVSGECGLWCSAHKQYKSLFFILFYFFKRRWCTVVNRMQHLVPCIKPVSLSCLGLAAIRSTALFLAVAERGGGGGH